MSSTSFWTCPSSTRNHLRKKCAIFDIVEKEWVLHVLRLILGGDGSWSWLQLGSLIEVASVHSCPICAMWYTTVLDISWILLWIDGRSDPPVPTYPFRCTSARSSQFWVAIHDFFGLQENDREFLGNVLPGRQLFCDISSVGGSFSARVPRSSAELHRGFVHHILEDEVDGQKEEQGDQREKGAEEEVNGRCRRDQKQRSHNAHETWDIDGMSECGPKLEPCKCMWLVRNTVKNGRVRCGVHTSRRLQQTTVSCERSNCNKPF